MTDFLADLFLTHIADVTRLSDRVKALEQRQRVDTQQLTKRMNTMAGDITTGLADIAAIKAAQALSDATTAKIVQDVKNALSTMQTLMNRIDMLEKALADQQASPELIAGIAAIKASALAHQTQLEAIDAAQPDEVAPDVAKADTHS
jgi:hypothetical protein